MSLVGLICQDFEVMLCGGRLQQTMETLETLFRRLSEAELIFFMDGFVRDAKRDTWMKRQHKKYLDSLKIMDLVYGRVPLSNIRHQNFYINTAINVIEEACKKFGKLHYTVEFECDQEIARFAFTNKRVLGIFSTDTDFMIFRGNWRYFSTKDLQLDTLRTKEFDRKALRDHLRLKAAELPIFAMLAGNDFLPEEDLRAFHNRISPQRKSKFVQIAKFVRRACAEKESFEMLLKFISKEVFGNTKEKQILRLKASIGFYDVLSDLESSQDEFLRNHHLFTYNVLNSSPFNFSLSFFDYRCSDIPSYYDLCVPMLQRQAGIVFMMTQTPDAHVKVYIKTSHFEKTRKFELAPIFPQFGVLICLEELYGDDPSHEYLRLALLKWSIDWEKLKEFYIEDFPDNYMIDILTLTFMKQRGVISREEANIFLWVIKNVENNTVPKGLKPPTVLNHRPFRLAFLYVKLFSNVARSIEVCGLKKKYWVRSLSYQKTLNLTFLISS